ncbi:heavy metal translocating P-type ATPase [Thalassococcus lentus]|uniref:Heavy metal translocating P-type ATPase n=1 Tax=Thalassococcus lentus TaxID=1210524 RepID=A0ABT4XSF9_9RHOB|nr:heavy metal translocating P-type ATPase [Thalassococcus lentus]MDA7424835.1 heavy metal translocating P-type ATPase [Thalassococcus lentus]
MATATLRFEVTNLSCAGCAGRAERALASVAGVEQAGVNLANRMATVAGDAGFSELNQALQDAGYPARTEVRTLQIRGMHCASCTQRIEAGLMALRGVTKAQVNLASEQARVTTVPGLVEQEDLTSTIKALGFDAEPLDCDDVVPPDASEQAQLRRDLWIAGILTLPVFLVEMGGHLVPPFHHWIHGTIGQQTSWLLQFILITAVLAIPGRRFYRIGLPLLAKGTPDMNSLVALGTLAAWGYSTLALFAPQALPQGTRAIYFEAAGVIVTLILLGRFLEARAKGRTRAAIRQLVGLRPDTAQVERDGQIVDIPVDQIVLGDVLSLKAGERVAVDGAVLTGRSFVDESMITGEPVPNEKSEGSMLVAGTVNGNGALRYRATAVGHDTVLARIIAMVQEAQGAKLPIQALADRVVRWFVPIVMALAALTVAIWLTFGPGLTFALVAGVSVLIIACPCAMGLATPTSIMVGTGRAAELGVLFRKGDTLQRLDTVKAIAFDKTGTLTRGRPELADQWAAPGFEASDVLRLAASAETGSDHPIAQALIQAATDSETPQSVEAIPGFGLRAIVDGQTVLVGAERLMNREDISLAPLEKALASMAAKGQTPVLVAVDGRIAGAFAVADQVKPEAARALAVLRERGISLAMITGDTASVARNVAADLGIDHVQAEVLPEGKRDAVRQLQIELGAVAFVGDGINDAPALAEADVGIAIGTGTDVAIESADVVLISGDLAGAVTALDVSRRVMRNIRQNLFWAFAYNAALIPVAAGILYPAIGMLLSPMLAAGAMALSSVFVLSNALRLRRMAPALAHNPDAQRRTLQQEAHA